MWSSHIIQAHCVPLLDYEEPSGHSHNDPLGACHGVKPETAGNSKRATTNPGSYSTTEQVPRPH